MYYSASSLAGGQAVAVAEWPDRESFNPPLFAYQLTLPVAPLKGSWVTAGCCGTVVEKHCPRSALSNSLNLAIFFLQLLRSTLSYPSNSQVTGTGHLHYWNNFVCNFGKCNLVSFRCIQKAAALTMSPLYLKTFPDSIFSAAPNKLPVFIF